VPIAVSVVAVVMGLNLLEVVQLNVPSFFTDIDSRKVNHHNSNTHNNNTHAYAGQLNSFTLLRALLVLTDRGILAQSK
jgi:hypothetical protein